MKNAGIKEAEVQIITFKIGGLYFASYLLHTQEVINLTQSILPVPGTPPYVSGIINFKGSILAIIDLIRIFGEEGFKKRSYKHILVVEEAGLEAGILIDAVPQIFQVPKTHSKPAVLPKKIKWAEYVPEEVEINGTYFNMLDIGKILKKNSMSR